MKYIKMLGEMLGLEDYIIDVNDLTSENLVLKITNAWKNKDKIVLQLNSQIPEIKKKSMQNGELVKEILESSN